VLFAKGNLRAALTMAHEEDMVDGQDPLLVMNRCSEVQLDAPVQLEIELCVQGREPLRLLLDELSTRRIEPALAWPTVLRVYVSVRSLQIKCEPGMWPCYMVAKRIRPQQMPAELSRFLGKLADRQLKFVMNVPKEQAK
jgi:hypothetical protein